MMKSNQTLSRLLLKYKNKPFKWGESDCCLFACDAVQMQTGIMLFDKHSGMYNSELSAKKYLAKIGGVESNLDKHFNRIDAGLMQRGDIAMCDSNAGRLLTVAWVGGLLAMTEEGCRLVNLDPLAVWRITCLN